MKTLITALASGIAGLVAGGGAMLVAFPFLFPPPAANDPLPGPASGIEAAAPASRLGAFEFDRDAPGRDALHWADGTGGIYRSGERLVLRLENNFRTGPGPNYIIYLNTVAVGEEKDFNADGGRVPIAKLRSFSGAQNYTLPVGLDLSRFHTVTIWCETFGVYIGSAVLPRSAS